jgi:hypothetical protein
MWQFAKLEPLCSFIAKAIKLREFTPDPMIPIFVKPDREVFERVKARLGDL